MPAIVNGPIQLEECGGAAVGEPTWHAADKPPRLNAQLDSAALNLQARFYIAVTSICSRVQGLVLHTDTRACRLTKGAAWSAWCF